MLGTLMLIGSVCVSAAFGARAYGRGTERIPGGTGETFAPAAGDTLVRLKVTSGNNIGITFFNTGLIGTNLANRTPSMEYPLRSGQDHLVRAGVWVGGIPAAESDTLVSTAAIDGSFGSFDPKQTSEYYPAGDIEERSILPDNRYYSPDAKSEQDFMIPYIDTRTGLNPKHKPLGLKIVCETMLYSFRPFDAIVIANVKVINVGVPGQPADPIFNVYVGMYSELASGWKDGHSEWPPSGWFKRKDISYVDSLRLETEHHYTQDNGNCPSWGGIQLLGTRSKLIRDMTVSFNWWEWDPNGTLHGTPVNDTLRYNMMRNGEITPTSGVEAPNSDPVELLSVGPFDVIEPGDTVLVSFAFLGGAPSPRDHRDALQDLIFKAKWAQKAFDANFNIPVPPPSPTLKMIPGHEKLTLRWVRSPEDFIDPKSHRRDFEGYRIYLSEQKEDEGFRMLRQVDKVDSLLENTGLHALRDSVQIDGIDYAYRFDIDHLKDGFKYWAAISSFDTGSNDIEPLESGFAQNRTFAVPGPGPEPIGKVKVFPNPYRGDATWDGTLTRDRYLWFVNLPARCTIKIFTLGGDLVDTIEFDQAAYNATEIRGIFDPTDVHNPETDTPILSGGMAAWDLITRKDQAVATGLYIFSVKDRATGKTQLGKFLVLK